MVLYIRIKHILKNIVNYVFFITICYFFFLVLEVTSLAPFRIPTDSMMPAIQPGDHICVEKWSLGARIFKIWKCRRGTEVDIHRLPALGNLKRNDVIVFNFPYYERWDSMCIDWKRYYVKRCVALPGDTFSIRDGMYRVNGYDGTLGNVEAQEDLYHLLRRCRKPSDFVSFRAYPLNDTIPWTIKDFGPFYIPKKGTAITMNPHNAILYRNVIEWEQKKSLYIKGDSILLGDSLITDYRFKENYYFTTGDNVMNSQDSRYWGLLPEPFIVGRAIYIWKSVNPVTEKIRWDRIMKRIK